MEIKRVGWDRQTDSYVDAVGSGFAYVLMQSTCWLKNRRTNLERIVHPCISCSAGMLHPLWGIRVFIRVLPVYSGVARSQVSPMQKALSSLALRGS